MSCSFVEIPVFLFSFLFLYSLLGHGEEAAERVVVAACIHLNNESSTAITGGKSRVARAPTQQHQHRCTMRVHADFELKTGARRTL